MPDATHPFERKNLGRAPFRFVRLVREPGGCAYCGRVLARSCHIADATGREFVVGTDCVWRAGALDPLVMRVQRELRHQNKVEAAEKREARRVACLTALQDDPGFLADKPHPDAWQTGKTLRDEACRLLRGNGGDRLKAFGIVEAASAEREAGASLPGRLLVRPGPEAKGSKAGTAPRLDAHASAAARRGGRREAALTDPSTVAPGPSREGEAPAATALVPVALAPPSAELVRNLEEHAWHARGAFAANTERALRADTAVFTGWCADAGLVHLPAVPGTVVAFVDAMASAKAPATIRRYVSSIATLHHAARLPSPTEAQEVKLALKRLHRVKGRAQAQAMPLNRGLVERMLTLPVPGLRDLRNRALLAVAYDTLARRSELVELLGEDLEIGPDGDGTIAVRRSKTDQEGAGAVCHLAADTVRVLRAWTDAAGITQGPLFRSVGKTGRIGGKLDRGDVARVFKTLARAAGVSVEEAARISGHSSRVGAAKDMVRHGVDLPAVMQAGRWRSPEMVGRYTRRLDARRSGAAKLAERQGRA